MKASKKRFSVALSFAGEQRGFIKPVAEFLVERLGLGTVFYDDYYKAELARPNLDTYLQQIYNQESELIVVFLSEDYARKEWCAPTEWRAIRELIKKQLADRIMFIRFDQAEIPGIFSHDGYLPVDELSPQEIGSHILERFSLCEQAPEAKQPEETKGSKPPADAGPIDSSGCLFLLGTQVFEAKNVKTAGDGKIVIRFATTKAAEDAAVKALSPSPFHQVEPMPFAHQNDAMMVKVKRLESESMGNGNLWTMELEPEDNRGHSGTFFEVNTGSLSVDDIAKKRASRILLNDPPPIPDQQPRRKGAFLVNDAWDEVLVAGLNTRIQAKDCPIVKLYPLVKSDPTFFMRAARLYAVFMLTATNTVEHVLELTFGPIKNGSMHVRFRGQRQKIYSNVAATIIELEGDCRLEQIK